MNVHVVQPTKADRIREAIADHPEMSSTEIANMLNVRSEYVRAVGHRSRNHTSKGRLRSSLLVAQRTYADALELRRQCEIDTTRDEALYNRYCRAWELHRAAEKVYLELARPPVSEAEEAKKAAPQIRGVPVREIIERQRHAGWVPVVGTVR